MRSVNIAELRNGLSAYLNCAKTGETIVIRDHDVPIAQLIPMDAGDWITHEERELVAAGLMTLAKKPWDPVAFLAMPRPELKDNSAVQAIIDDRDDDH